MNTPEPLNHMAKMMETWSQRAIEAQAKAAQAYARLLNIALTSDTGQAARVARFVAATYNGTKFKFDLFDLRPMDVEISDDMLVCIDCLRWGRADLYRLVPDGEAQVQEVIREWGLNAKDPKEKE